jgi:SAM-dependent methyltransferase
MTLHYGSSFYERQSNETRESADIIVRRLIDLVNPQSVIDVGCGTGSWLRSFQEHGVSDVRGFDGPWLDIDKLLIPRGLFARADFEKPLRVERRVDAAISLEVAEHLSPESAAGFVESLTSMSDVVAFSAAIPFQGGHHHLNEQWPEYWANLFEQQGYVALDCFRLPLWNDARIHYWYRQNLLLYVKEEALERYPRLAPYREQAWGPLPFVHPALYIPGAAFLHHMGLLDVTRLWFRVLGRTVSRRLRSIFMPGQKSGAAVLPPRPIGAPIDRRVETPALP